MTGRNRVPVIPAGWSRIRLGGRFVEVYAAAPITLEDRCPHGRSSTECVICSPALRTVARRMAR